MLKKSKYYDRLIDSFLELTDGDLDDAQYLYKALMQRYYEDRGMTVEDFDEFLELGEELGFTINDQLSTMVKLVKRLEKNYINFSKN